MIRWLCRNCKVRKLYFCQIPEQDFFCVILLGSQVGFFYVSMKKDKLSLLLNPIFIIVIAVLLRLVPHIPNMTPIAAMALFGGAYLNKKYALLVPLAAMVVSDLFLGFSQITFFVYISFLLIGGLGLLLRHHKTMPWIIGASLASSILFFILTNFGVWVLYNFYPKTIAGLMECYIAGIPFFRNTIIGDLFYTGVFFGGYELVRSKIKWQNYRSNLKI